MSKIERPSPETTWVRVTRKQTLEIVEYVDVQICRYPHERNSVGADSDEEIAERLATAKVDAGEDVAWFIVSEIPTKYSRSDYTTELLPDGPGHHDAPLGPASE